MVSTGTLLHEDLKSKILFLYFISTEANVEINFMYRSVSLCTLQFPVDSNKFSDLSVLHWPLSCSGRYRDVGGGCWAVR
jgi:hypothetical protein